MTDRSFITECPVCQETLFDEDGVASQEVAEIMCNHLVHSDCLAQAGRSLNADGQRYGIGGFGPRAGCPVCGQPVSSWSCSKEIEFFRGFWLGRIEKVLKELGPEKSPDGTQKLPVPGEKVRDTLLQDTSLSEKAKKHIKKIDSDMLGFDMSSGFCKALKGAGSVDWNVDQVIFAGFLISRGIWHYDKQKDNLWLWEWGLQHPGVSRCNYCRTQKPDLIVCDGCKDSSQAAYYCSPQCRDSDSNQHQKNMCRSFQIMKQGGTREELLQRLRDA